MKRRVFLIAVASTGLPLAAYPQDTESSSGEEVEVALVDFTEKTDQASLADWMAGEDAEYFAVGVVDGKAVCLGVTDQAFSYLKAADCILPAVDVQPLDKSNTKAALSKRAVARFEGGDHTIYLLKNVGVDLDSEAMPRDPPPPDRLRGEPKGGVGVQLSSVRIIGTVSGMIPNPPKAAEEPPPQEPEPDREPPPDQPVAVASADGQLTLIMRRSAAEAYLEDLKEDILVGSLQLDEYATANRGSDE